jgi:hypothetical protein
MGKRTLPCSADGDQSAEDAAVEALIQEASARWGSSGLAAILDAAEQNMVNLFVARLAERKPS